MWVGALVVRFGSTFTCRALSLAPGACFKDFISLPENLAKMNSWSNPGGENIFTKFLYKKQHEDAQRPQESVRSRD